MTAIGWLTSVPIVLGTAHEHDWKDLAYYEPEPLLDVGYEGNDSEFFGCPAFRNFISGFFVYRCPIDLHFTVTRSATGQGEIKVAKPESDPRFVIETEILKRLLVLRPKNEPPVLGIDFGDVFISDTPDVWMEVFPPFLHQTSKPIRLVPGNLDIHSWHRNVEYAFQIMADSANLEFQRGEPLFYLRFRNYSDPLDTFQIKRLKVTEDIRRSVQRCNTYKTFVPGGSWKMMLAKKNREISEANYLTDDQNK
jgi:hypothetical protein